MPGPIQETERESSASALLSERTPQANRPAASSARVGRGAPLQASGMAVVRPIVHRGVGLRSRETRGTGCSGPGSLRPSRGVPWRGRGFCCPRVIGRDVLIDASGRSGS